MLRPRAGVSIPANGFSGAACEQVTSAGIWLTLGMRSHTSLAAESLFVRKQLAFYAEHRVKPRRLDDATRLTLVVLARFIEWRHLLRVVQPETLSADFG